jgi:two-component system LytT family response regulator
VFFIKAEEIDWLEAEGNYVRLHAGKESYLLRDTISALESQLDPKKFIRVHRSAIVNMIGSLSCSLGSMVSIELF